MLIQHSANLSLLLSDEFWILIVAVGGVVVMGSIADAGEIQTQVAKYLSSLPKLTNALQSYHATEHLYIHSIITLMHFSYKSSMCI